MSQEKLCKSLIAKGFNKTSAIKISKKKYALQPKQPIDESVFTGKDRNSEYVDNLNAKLKPLTDAVAASEPATPLTNKNTPNQPDIPTKMDMEYKEDGLSIHDVIRPPMPEDTTVDSFEPDNADLKKAADNPSKNDMSPAAPPAQPNYDIHTSAAVRDEQGHRIKRKIVTEYELEPVKEPKQVTISELPKDKNDN